MWRRLAAYMRIDGFGPGGKPNPLKRRSAPAASLLAEVDFAGFNPGNLRQFRYVPNGLKNAPLVVILHGCTQTATGYDHGAGWSELAAQQGFAVLAPEQKSVNNPGTCFNWFNPTDVTRGEGEAASIAAMIEDMVTTHHLDPKRVFITGLSAGGAMTAAMLACYPELFAGGAIIAGLPYGAAANVMEALEVMRTAPVKTPREWGHLARAASHHRGDRPRVSIWHGDRDQTVNVGNAQASLAQWADLDGLKLADAQQETVEGGAVHLSWGDQLEIYTVPGLGHGTPIDSAVLGKPGPFILEAGISSTSRIARFWGLAEPKAAAKPRPARIVPSAPAAALPKIEVAVMAQHHARPPVNAKAEHVIVRALKAAGLIRKR
jgi:poly(hydroxyalkanoate) depolymerase family esterase